MKEEIDFYPVQKIVKEQRGNKGPDIFISSKYDIFDSASNMVRREFANPVYECVSIEIVRMADNNTRESGHNRLTGLVIKERLLKCATQNEST